MFDRKKLEALLDGLEVNNHYPSEAPKKIIALPRSALDEKMDKYDIFKQGDYQNVGTPEFPIWGKHMEADLIQVSIIFTPTAIIDLPALCLRDRPPP